MADIGATAQDFADFKDLYGRAKEVQAAREFGFPLAPVPAAPPGQPDPK
jgi:hypothetical protein